MNNAPTDASDPSGEDYLDIRGGIAFWVQGQPGQKDLYYAGRKSGFTYLSTKQTVRIGSVKNGRITYDEAVGGGESSVGWLTGKIDEASFVTDGITWEDGGRRQTVKAGFWSLTDAQQQEVVKDYLGGKVKLSVVAEEAKFLSWYNAEKKSMSWLDPLMKAPFLPPATLAKDKNGDFVLPAGWEWDSDTYRAYYHPGSAKGIRKDDTSGVAAQAMYDSNGNLITGGLGAGTADRSNSRGYWDWQTCWLREGGHWNVDVVPFQWAKDVDEALGDGKRFRELYIEVRPAISPPGVKENIVDK